jgi:hypothetical protein
MKPFEVTLTHGDDEYGTWRGTLRIIHKGEVIQEETDGGEPEDQSFYRDWKWVRAAIERAYALGLDDGRREATPTSSNPVEPK